MIGVQTTEGAASAWLFLRCSPDYIEGWRAAADGVDALEDGPIPIRAQTEADLGAAAWGLLAWEDPFAQDGPASPFWSDAPMPEGVPGRPGTTPFAALVGGTGGAVSGLRLRDGTLILRVERGAAAAQIRIADGDGFDPAGGLGLYQACDLDLLVQLGRAADLWSVIGPEAGRAPSPGPLRASFCSPSTAS